MKYLVFLFLSASLLFTSCVSTSKYEKAVQEKEQAQSRADSLQYYINGLNTELAYKQKQLSDMQERYEDLSERYDQLKENSTEGALQMIEQLEELQKDIAEREKRLDEVQQKLEAREKILNNLKATVQNALLGFEKSELSVSVKNGKVYVSLSNKLLFASGSTRIDKKGQDALKELSKVLSNQPDINILVEGHTDDQDLKSGQRFKDNWDLSVLRATEVVRKLTEEGNVDPQRITASGRSKFFPVADADTPEARAKNRRTEIILTPKLEKLYNIIDKS